MLCFEVIQILSRLLTRCADEAAQFIVRYRVVMIIDISIRAPWEKRKEGTPRLTGLHVISLCSILY